jgi:hypothetical protein
LGSLAAQQDERRNRCNNHVGPMTADPHAKIVR